MRNLKLRISLVATGLILLALASGWFGARFLKDATEQIQEVHLGIAAFVFIGLCGMTLHGLLERGLNPILTLTDTFAMMRAEDFNPKLPVEGPDEMQKMALAFNEMMEDLEIQIREVTEEKQSAEKARQCLVEQVQDCDRFRALVDSAPLGIAMADAELNIVYQNAASESGLQQLSSFLTWNSEVVVGRSLTLLYPDEEAALTILSNPDLMPWETSVSVGPYAVELSANAVYNSEGDYIGPMLIWQVVDEPEKIAAETLEESTAASLQDHRVGTSSNGAAAAAAARLERGSSLVSRSVRLLSERVSTITSMVEALCNEGENLRRYAEETRQRTQNTAYLTAERSESLWDLINELNGRVERARASTVHIKRLRKALNETNVIPESVKNFGQSIEHMALEARMEVSRAGDAGTGMKVVVEEIRRLSKEAFRLSRLVVGKLDRTRSEVDDTLGRWEQDRADVRSGGRVAKRAEAALERIDRDLSDLNKRTELLAEIAVGQAEIGSHISEQLTQLSEVAGVTLRVAQEQMRLVQRSLGAKGDQPEISAEQHV